MQSLADSLKRARRELAAALDRSDVEAAELLAKAVAVLEAAENGCPLPGQRTCAE